MAFRKISAEEQIFKDKKNKHEMVYNDFLNFAEELSSKKGEKKKKWQSSILCQIFSEISHPIQRKF